MGGHKFGFERRTQFHLCLYLIVECIVTLFVVDLFVDAFCPVVGGDIGVSLYHISIYIELSPYVFHRFPCVGSTVGIGTISGCSDTDFGNAVTYGAIGSSRSRLIVIVHDIYFHAFTAITSVAGPVIEYIIAQIHIFTFLCSGTRAETGDTTFMVGHQIVMVGSMSASPVTAITMYSFAVS